MVLYPQQRKSRGIEYLCECNKYKAPRHGKNSRRYSNGSFFCKRCRTYITIEGTVLSKSGRKLCKCCGRALRVKPRKGTYKEIYRNETNKKTNQANSGVVNVC